MSNLLSGGSANCSLHRHLVSILRKLGDASRVPNWLERNIANESRKGHLASRLISITVPISPFEVRWSPNAQINLIRAVPGTQ
jgi:hypothetical protein